MFTRGKPGMILPTGTVADAEEGPIPAAGIAYESAQQILRFAKKGATRLRLALECSYEQSTTWNVIGELAGTEFPDELVIMGGHLDSHDTTPGAVDNASGVVQVMEAARLLASQRRHLKRTVRFIGFGAEEVGLLGSHHHARKHADRLRSARFMLNSDCPGLGSPKGLSFHGLPGAQPYIEMLAGEMGTPIVFQDGFNRHSDHYPFMLEGLATAGMRSGKFKPGVGGFGHTAADTPDKISVTDLREGAAFAARILLRASSDERWPSLRRSSEQVQALIAETDEKKG
jgi:Zn-dependent M28 family amino/carboxypeptidase